MNKYDFKLNIIAIVFIITVLLEIYSGLALTNINEGSITLDDVYLYSVEDSKIQNPELLDYFINNSKNNLDCYLLTVVEGDFEENSFYKILFKEGKFIVDTYVEGNIVSTKEFTNLNEVNIDEYTYYFLSNEKVLDELMIENYFYGNCFEVFELGRVFS